MRRIRFLRGWQGRGRGFVDARLSAGVMDALVSRRIAEWVEPDEPEPPEEKPKGRKANARTDRTGNAAV